MADQREAGISWTDETWNPVVGCSIVSPACTNCYAMSVAAMIERASGGRTHYAGTTKIVNGKPVWTGKLDLAPEHIVNNPLRWKRPRRVFVNSMSDLFHENMPEAWIDRVFATMALSPRHTFQVLTKRPGVMRRYVSDPATVKRVYFMVCDIALALNLDRTLIARGEHEAHAPPGERVFLGDWPLLNVWLGVTAEDQTRADERIPHLQATPAAVRFVSAEPLLGPLDLQRFMERCHANRDGDCWAKSCPQLRDGEPLRSGRHCPIDTWGVDDEHLRPLLDWIIVGGESGPGARPTHPDWARSIRDQCAAAGVAFHFKQWGDWSTAIDRERDDPDWRADYQWKYADGEKTRWLNIAGGRGFHGERFHVMRRIGKRAAGRALDGAIHDAFPVAP